MPNRSPRPGASARRALVLCAVLVAAPTAVSGAAGEPGPTFVKGSCGALQLSRQVAARVRCGTVAVPRDHRRPDGQTFALAVVVIASATQPAPPDADLYISGGPGGPLTAFAEAQARHPLAADRDQVLVDQRGTGASEPALCPALDGALAAQVAADRSAAAARRAAFANCRAQAVARGIDLAEFGTAVTVEDLDSVRRALGIARWNVFGVSYGTTVAMTMLALHPDTIRSAVLDSVYPPDPILPPWARNVADARDSFFASCEADAPCRTAYPDLADTFRDTLRRLADAPPIIPFPPGMGRPDDRGPLTAPLFAFVVAHLVYYPDHYSGLPRLIAAAHDGDTEPFASAMATLFAAATDRQTGTRLSLQAAVECRDRPRLHGASAPPEDPQDLTTLRDVCDDWAAVGPPPLVPRDTAVPTLVLAGQFDPNARPADSRRVAEMIGARAQWIEVMGMGHSVRAFSPCASAIVAGFIDHPERPVDGSCAGRAPPLRVLPPLGPAR